MRKSTCSCAKDFQVFQIRATEYGRLKKILDRGKHPAFIGRALVANCGRNGGAFVFSANGVDVACAVVNPKTNTLLVLNVDPAHRSHGIGSAVLLFLQCNFARVLENAVPFFERNGYSKVGALKRGNSLNTQVMVKSSLIPLAGRLSKIMGPK